MLAILAPIIVFGLVIFVHELGHFIAAKLTGVYAPRFSIGFGPALWRHRRGETEYVLAAFPLGGYVRMASRHDAETSFIEGGGEGESDALKPGQPGYDPDAMLPFGPRPVPENRWFESKSLPARLFIMIAGVTMNVLLAFVVLTGLAFTYGRPMVATRVVGAVRPLATAPALAQLQPGDTVVAVNGATVRTWDDVIERVRATGPGTVSLRTTRGEVVVPVGASGAPSAGELADAIEFRLAPVIGDVLPGSPAKRAGLRAGDTIVAIGNVPLRDWTGLQEQVTPAAGRELPFQVRRGGRVLTLTIRPESTTVKDAATGVVRMSGKIGAAPDIPTTSEPIAVGDAFAIGARATWREAGTVVGIVRGLLTREVSLRQLGGPIAITRASVAAAQSGFERLFSLIALLSVNVAVLNLLPIPILDGGQILINIAESMKGSPFSARTREYVLRAGLVAILLIFVMSTFNDVVMLGKDLWVKLFG